MRGDDMHVGLVKSLCRSEGPFLSLLGLQGRKGGWGRGWWFPWPCSGCKCHLLQPHTWSPEQAVGRPGPPQPMAG